MLYVCAIHIRCTHIYSPDSSLIDKRKNCQCWNSGIRQFRLLYICLSEQQHATLSAPVHSCRLPISSFFLRKKENKEQSIIKQYNNRFTTLAHYMHILCETNRDIILAQIRLNKRLRFSNYINY
jgi:hypothetical protein